MSDCLVHQAVEQACATELTSNQPCVVGYSGGLDSTVLLHALKHLGAVKDAPNALNLHALHVNHQLSPQAQDWAGHCQQFCRSQAIPLTVIEVDAHPAPGQSPEAAARAARYAAFSEQLTANAALCLAHHQADQAETLLLQLMRGAGPAGLAAMGAVQSYKHFKLLRPFLHLPREALAAYAAHHHLSWVEDASNQDQRLDRNYIRHQVLPVLQKRWPSAKATIARSSQACADAAVFESQFAARTVRDVQLAPEDQPALWRETLAQPAPLSCRALSALGQRQAYAVLRWHITHCGLATPHRRHLDRLWHEVIEARADAQPLLAWPGVHVRRYRDGLYVMRPLPPFTPKPLLWHAPHQPLAMPAPFKALHYVGPERAEPLVVRFRQGGERVQLPRRAGRHQLKKLMQTSAVLPWLRDRLPLVYEQDQLIAIPGLLKCTFMHVHLAG